MQEKQPSDSLQPLPLARDALQKAGALRSRGQPKRRCIARRERVAWNLFRRPKKCLRRSFAHGDSWLSHIISVQEMKQFTQHRGGGGAAV